MFMSNWHYPPENVLRFVCIAVLGNACLKIISFCLPGSACFCLPGSARFCLSGSAWFCLSGSAWFCLSRSAGFVLLGVLGFVCLGVLFCFVLVLLEVLGSARLSGPVFDLRPSMDACFGLSGSAWFCLSGSR